LTGLMVWTANLWRLDILINGHVFAEWSECNEYTLSVPFVGVFAILESGDYLEVKSPSGGWQPWTAWATLWLTEERTN